MEKMEKVYFSRTLVTSFLTRGRHKTEESKNTTLPSDSKYHDQYRRGALPIPVYSSTSELHTHPQIVKE
jgi:hypothetical protein